MASKLNKDDYIYDEGQLSALMVSLDTESAGPGARPKKSKRLAAKSAGRSDHPQTPASSTESFLKLERLKNQNCKVELEITKAKLELAKLQSASAEPHTPLSGQPRSLKAALTSTPANTTTAVIPTLEQLAPR